MQPIEWWMQNDISVVGLVRESLYPHWVPCERELLTLSWGSGVAIARSTCLAKVKSLRMLGALFDSSGFNGRVCLCPCALQDLATLFAFHRDFHLCGCLHSINFRQRSARSRNTCRRVHPVSHASVTLRRMSQKVPHEPTPMFETIRKRMRS